VVGQLNTGTCNKSVSGKCPSPVAAAALPSASKLTLPPGERRKKVKLLLPMSATAAAAVRRLCAFGELRSALAVLARGTNAGDAALDVAACTALVHDCCKSGDVAGARRVFDVMPRLGVAPNEVTYTALIHGYFVHGNRETGFALFEEMMRSGVELNLYTYNCLIGEWCRTGELERARPCSTKCLPRASCATLSAHRGAMQAQ
jgi:pentatricopeptide repeat protein